VVHADQVLAPIYARGDRIMGVLIGVHAGVAAVLAPVYGTYRVSLAVAVLAAGAFFAARRLRPGSGLVRCMAGLPFRRSARCTSTS
jgi:hypothetical protein